MKLGLASDLHLEFANKVLKNPGVDALVLSGDIMLAQSLPENMTDEYARNRRKLFTGFFEQVSKEFPQVFYVMGNHEHYHGDFQTSATKIREFLERNSFDNVTFLDKETVDFGPYKVFGATLWSDFNRDDWRSKEAARRMMNDYQIVENSAYLPVVDPYSYGKSKNYLSPDDTLLEHRQTLAALETTLKLGEPTLVFTHHSPSFQSVHDFYKEEKYTNGAYHSSLEHVMDKYPNLKLWTHGHTHFEFDYQVYETRVVCNPRGYEGYEAQAKNFQLKVIEL